jgi:DNA-binding LacI/PurR family transcriptional regulator
VPLLDRDHLSVHGDVELPGGGPNESEGAPSVETNDVGGARAAAEHLLGLGNERLGVVSFELDRDARGGLADLERHRGATYRPSRLRLDGYAAAVEAAGLSWENVPIYEAAGNAPGQGRIAVEVLLSRSPRPTAILTLSDQLAFGVFEAAKKMGLSIPEDLSVVGFDDVSEASRTGPPLMTVYQPHVEKGLVAGRMLVAQLGDEEPRSPYRPGSSSAARPPVQGPPRSLTGVFETISSAIMAASDTYEEEHR